MIGSSAAGRLVALAAALLWATGPSSHAAFAEDAGAPAPAASAAAPAPAATAVAARVALEAIRVKEDGARWENAYGEKFFQVVGTVTNGGSAPVGAVRIRVELLGASGEVVKTFDGWNVRAEALGDLDDTAAAEELAELEPGPIDPGDSDHFRSTFLADETPAFVSHRARVVSVLPPP